MAIAFPILVDDDRLVGTGFVAGQRDNYTAIVTALHILGNGQKFHVVIPPHGGDVSMPQIYPVTGDLRTFEAELVIVETLLDIGILLVDDPALKIPSPR